MIRFLKLAMVVSLGLCVFALMVWAGGVLKKETYTGQMSVNADTTAGDYSYASWTIGLSNDMQKYDDASVAYRVNSGYPALHGLGNADSCIVKIYSDFLHKRHLLDSQLFSAVPCSSSWRNGTGDTLWENIYMVVYVEDSSSDTTYTANFKVDYSFIAKDN